MSTTAPDVLVRHPDDLGECPAYDAAGQRLVWVDNRAELVHEHRWTGAGGWQPGRTWSLGDFAAAVVPRAAGGLLVARRTDVVGLDDDGGIEVLAVLEDDDLVSVSFNDGKCDADGRFVVGVMVEDGHRPGSVVRLDAEGRFETIVNGVGTPNGIDWSPDGRTLYVVDTSGLCVEAFDYDAVEGAAVNRRTFAAIERGAGAPDGLAVDDEGHVWVAVPWAGQLRRYAPDGEQVGGLHTPTPMLTSCAFGGPDREELFITSCSLKLPAAVPESFGVARQAIDAADRDEAGGAVFVCRPGVSGPAARAFAG